MIRENDWNTPPGSGRRAALWLLGALVVAGGVGLSYVMPEYQPASAAQLERPEPPARDGAGPPPSLVRRARGYCRGEGSFLATTIGTFQWAGEPDRFRSLQPPKVRMFHVCEVDDLWINEYGDTVIQLRHTDLGFLVQEPAAAVCRAMHSCADARP